MVNGQIVSGKNSLEFAQVRRLDQILTESSFDGSMPTVSVAVTWDGDQDETRVLRQLPDTARHFHPIHSRQSYIAQKSVLDAIEVRLQSAVWVESQMDAVSKGNRKLSQGNCRIFTA